MSDSRDVPLIQFPRNIITYSVRNIDHNPTCEDVIFACLQQLAESPVLRENPSSDDDLMKWLPAFGLVQEENESVWLLPSFVFRRTNKKEVYKIRIRHRPPASKIFQDNCLFSEFFVLQALDDFLHGPLGKHAQMSKNDLMQVTALALLFPLSPDSQPWKNSEVVDEKNKLESFKLHSYQKRFSKEIYKKIISTKSPMNRVIDHYYHFGALKALIDGHKKKRRKFFDYKVAFTQIILENFPRYCFEEYEALEIDEHGMSRKAKISLNNLYNEFKDQPAGVFIDEVRICALEDIERVELKKHDETWEIDIFTKSLPQTLRFEKEDVAISFISMLQGYMNLCFSPDVVLCRQLTSSAALGQDKISSVTIRDYLLKSFCSMRFEEACDCLRKENSHKVAADQCGYLIHQSTKRLHDYFVVLTKSRDGPECSIRWLGGTRFELIPLQGNPQEFPNHEKLRMHLKGHYGQQLLAKRVAQSVDPDSVFFVSKTLMTTFLESEEVSGGKSECLNTTVIMERDVVVKMDYESSERDERLKREIVEVKEEKRIQATLTVKKRAFIEAFHNAVYKTAELSRIHPTMIMNYFGPVLAPMTPLPFLFEYSDFRDILTFLKINGKGITTLLRMEFALEVVKILCALTQPRENSSTILHGNLRAHNFWVFKWMNKRDRYYLKLGDPGLVHIYNTFELTDIDNKKRIPWLAPERKRNLQEVTVASEVYAAATTIAEIFHGSDDFTTIIDQTGGKRMEIPMPKFPESEDEAVMDSVIQVTKKLWETLKQCWVANPEERLSPRELSNAIIDHLEDARDIPQEKVLLDLRAFTEELCDVPTENFTAAQCHNELKKKDLNFIPPQEITFNPEVLGGGFFGTVKKGFIKGVPVAIKHANATSSTGERVNVNWKMESELMEEAKLNAKLDHKNIVKVLYSSRYKGKLLIILEFMNEKCLKSYAKKNGSSLMRDRGMERINYIKRLLKICKDIAEGMEYLHKHRVVHCDLASRNVLLNVDSNGLYTAKVADFGLSRVFNKHQYYAYVGDLEARPLYWYPPEYLLFEHDGLDSSGVSFTKPGDVWMYGTTLWEIFSMGMSPSEIKKQRATDNEPVEVWLFDFYMKAKERWPKQEYMDQDVYAVMMKCWRENPGDRPIFTQLKEDFEQLLSHYKSIIL